MSWTDMDLKTFAAGLALGGRFGGTVSGLTFRPLAAAGGRIVTIAQPQMRPLSAANACIAALAPPNMRVLAAADAQIGEQGEER